MQSLTIVALDPGVTTGWADLNRERYSTRQLTGEHHVELWDALYNLEPDIVVCERFTYQRRDKVILKSVEYIGVVTLYCEQYKVPLRMQTPSQAKNLWTDNKLKLVGQYKPNQPHANDAMRHLLYCETVHLKDLKWISRLKEASQQS